MTLQDYLMQMLGRFGIQPPQQQQPVVEPPHMQPQMAPVIKTPQPAALSPAQNAFRGFLGFPSGPAEKGILQPRNAAAGQPALNPGVRPGQPPSFLGTRG